MRDRKWWAFGRARAALKYLIRYLTEGEPSLADVAQMVALLAERSLPVRSFRSSSIEVIP